MNKFYSFFLLKFFIILSNSLFAQSSCGIEATAKGFESRCASTGSIKVTVTVGVGVFKYKVVGPVTTNFTTSDSITGLPAGNYSVIVNEINSNCEVIINNVVVSGNYQDPRFDLTKIDVSCENGNNGSIIVTNPMYGRQPYSYSIVAPSPMGVGTTNNTGIFANLSFGDYSIRMTDSCGGIQTRRVYVNNYTWSITAYPFTKISCDSASGYIRVVDSKGNVSNTTGIPGFMYGIVRSVGDTLWSSQANFNFYLNGSTSFEVIAKDPCSNIKKGATAISFTPSIAADVTIANIACNSFSASVTNPVNIFNPVYNLYNASNVLVSSNTTGAFTNLTYGSYCIRLVNGCNDTTISRCFTQAPPPIAVGNIIQSNRTCNNFTATVIGQVGLTNPTYCIFNSSNVQLACNSTGIFTNLPYGAYCIKVTDGCRDTTFTRCFTAIRPRPSVQGTVTQLYTTCSNFGVSLGGDTLSSPQYCLYNSSGVQLLCNTTGIFDSLAYGNYCINVYDPCFDTTIIRCFNIPSPIVIPNIAVTISNLACSTFTATASGSNLTNPQYCVYNSSNVLVSCNSTGVFSNLTYGLYTLRTRNGCPDTTFVINFSQLAAVPAVATNVAYNNYTCSTFTARITGQTNLTNPNYCIYNSSNVQLACNTTGRFDNLPYGSYCIRIANTCPDTTIERCFTRNPRVFGLDLDVEKSCSYGYATFHIDFNNPIYPVNIVIVRPNGSIFLNKNYTADHFDVDSIPGTLTGQFYKIIATDACGNKDSVSVSAIASFFNRLSQVISRCPSASASNGSGNIKAIASTNMGTISVVITKRNGVAYPSPLLPNTVVGGEYTFNDLTPATYIVRYRENNCAKNLFDTVVIKNYVYPSLNKSTAYVCNVGGFSVGAVATDGVAPFTYEIIGSTPAIPSLITAPQGSPIFNINNGTNYSLIRLRAIDACGNGTLNDVSIMPLANTGISESFDCYAGATTLSIDSIYNATYKWYKKNNSTDTDSIYLGEGLSYFIPSLTPADTGAYVCVVNINNGCIIQHHTNLVQGDCIGMLSTKLKSFTGNYSASSVALQFTTLQESNLQKIWVEKRNGTAFQTIGNVSAIGTSSVEQQYNFIDPQPNNGTNYYRLRLQHFNGTSSYSTILKLDRLNKNLEIAVYPNPVQKHFTVLLKERLTSNYTLTLYNAIGEIIHTQRYQQANGSMLVERNNLWKNGVYTLLVEDEQRKKKSIIRLVLL